jgi:iron(III) transport system substrate-binding protein
MYEAEGYASAVAKAFTAKTGIIVKDVNHSTGTLLAKIQAEGSNPQWSFLWVDGNEPFAAMDKAGGLVRGFEPTTGTLNSVGKSLVPPDHSYIPTGTTIAGALVYDSKVVKDPPSSWRELTAPEWKGKVGMNNPALSGPTYPFVAGMMQQLGGIKAGEKYFEALKANGLHVYGTNKITLAALANGTIDLAVVQNSAGLGFGFTNPAIKVAYPSKVTLLPGIIGIDGKAPADQIAEAEEFADFVYSPAGQAAMLAGDPHGDSLFDPIIEGTKPHSEVPALSSLPLQTINPYVWGPRENAVNTFFTDNIVN